MQNLRKNFGIWKIAGILSEFRRISVVLIAVSFVALPSVFGQGVWDGGGDGTNWSSQANWDNDLVPTTGIAINLSAASGTVIYDASAVNTPFGALTLPLAQSFQLAIDVGFSTVALEGAGVQTVNLNGNTMTPSGATTINAGETLLLTDGSGSGTYAGDISNSGTVQLTGTTPQQTGTITMAGGSSVLDVDVAASVGTVTLTGAAEIQLGAVTLTAADVNVQTSKLIVSGGGTITNTAAIDIGAAGELEIAAATTVGAVDITGASGILDIDAAVTSGDVTLTATGIIQIATGITLTTGDVTINAQTAQFNEANGGTLALTAFKDLYVTTGQITVVESFTIDASTVGTSVILGATPTIDVTDNMKLTIDGTLTNSVATALTLSTGGTGTNLDFAAGSAIEVVADMDWSVGGSFTVDPGNVTDLTLGSGASAAARFNPGASLTYTTLNNIGGIGSYALELTSGAGTYTYTMGTAVTTSNNVDILGDEVLDMNGQNLIIDTNDEVDFNSTGASVIDAQVQVSGILTITDGSTNFASASVIFSADGAVVNVAATETIPTLTPTNSGTLNLTGALTVTNAVTVPTAEVMTFGGNTSGEFLNAAITVNGTGELNITPALNASLPAVTLGGASAILDIDAGNEITTLTVTSGGILDLAATLEVQNAALVVENNATLDMRGTGSGKLTQLDGTTPANITLGNGGNTGTLHLNNALAADVVGDVTVAVDGGVINADYANTIGAVTLSAGVGDLDLQVANGFTLVTDGFTINDNKLTLSEAGGTVNNSAAINIGASPGEVEIQQAFTIGDITTSGAGAVLDVNATATIGAVTLGNTMTMSLNGTTLSSDGIDLSGNTLSLTETGTISNSAALAVNGGNLTVGGAHTVSGIITTSGGASTLTLNAMLTYSNATDISVGAVVLTVAGTNQFNNTGGGKVVLDNASSELTFSGAAQVDLVESGNAVAKINVGDSGTISTLSFTGTNGADIVFTTTGKTLTITNAFSLPAGGGTLIISGAQDGSLAGGKITLPNGTSKLQVTNTNGSASIGNNIEIGTGTKIDIDDDVTISGNIDLSGATATIDILDAKTLTMGGSGAVTNAAASVAGTLTFNGGGASGTMKFGTGGIVLANNLTFALTNSAVTNYSVLQNLKASANATFDPGETTINLAAIATIGGTSAGITLSLISAGNDVDYTFARPLTTSGDLYVKESSLTLSGSDVFTLGSGHTMTVTRPTSFSPSAGTFDPTAGTFIVDIWIDANANGSADILSGELIFTIIQDAITASSSGDLIMIADGTFSEDFSIPSTKSNLEIRSLNGSASSILVGVADSAQSDWPAADPNIEILASGVKLNGFTIRGPSATPDSFAAGLVIGASGSATVTNIEIFNNKFEVTASADSFIGGTGVSFGIQTISVDSVPGIDIGGLKIYDNQFVNLGSGTAGYGGIAIRRDAGSDSVVVRNNSFTGKIYQGIETQRSNTSITRNSIVTDMLRGGGKGLYGILVADSAGNAIDNVDISHNVVKGGQDGAGFSEGIHIGGKGQTNNLTDITVSTDTIWNHYEGIHVRDAANGVVIQNCYLLGNYWFGINNENFSGQDLQLDARKNYWGYGSGPHHVVDNPSSIGSHMSEDLLFSPWLKSPLGDVITVYAELQAINDTTYREGESITITLAPFLYTGDGTLRYSLESSDIPAASNMNFDADEKKFTWAPDFEMSGDYQVTFGITDGLAVNTESVTLTISDVDLSTGGVTVNPDTTAVTAGSTDTVAVGTGGIYTGHRIVIPPGALVANKTLIARSATTGDVPAAMLANAPSAVVFEVQGEESSFTFADSVDMTLEYKDFELGTGSDESVMRIHYWDAAIQAWKREMAEQTVNQPLNIVSVKVNHLSTFAVLPVNSASLGMTTAVGWNMVSVPLEPTPANPATVFDGIRAFSLLENGASIYQYDEVADDWTVPTAVQSSIGYIVYAFDDDAVSPSGLEVTGNITRTLTRTGTNGWHLLGNPYQVDVDWLVDVTLSGNVDATYYRWNGTQYEFYPGGNLTQAISPWKGFWVHTSASNETVTFTYPGVAKPVVDTEREFAWRMQIEASSGALQDQHNYFGIAADADVLYDAADVYELAPINQSFISAYFAHPEWEGHEGNFTQDIRIESDEPQVWNFTVATNSPEETVLLNWEAPADLLPGWTMTLTDLREQRTVDMSNHLSYRFTKTVALPKQAGPGPAIAPNPTDFTSKLAADDVVLQHFTITVAPAVEAPAALPDEFYLTQNYPNPFNAGTTIQYGLPVDEQVELAIYNLLGQKIRTLVSERQEAGVRQVVWDGANAQGVHTASGVYIYRIQAGDFVRSRKLIMLR
jgi:hypothetical protein